MKRFSLFLITTLLLTGCSSAQEETKIQTKIQTENQTSTEVEPETKSAEKIETNTKPESNTKSERQSEKVSMNTAILKTSMGDITIELFPNQAPKTVKNFVDLATGAKEWTDPNVGEKVKTKLYDGTIFHRVIPGFMIQGGDPLGSGMGGPGYNFADEFHGELSFDKPYLLAMAAISSDNKNYVFTATDGGFAKRTKLEEYRTQGRGGIGVKAAKIDEDSRGVLVGAMIVQESDEILAISSAGTVMRTPLTQIRETGRDTLGVRLVNLDAGISVVSVTRLVEDLD